MAGSFVHAYPHVCISLENTLANKTGAWRYIRPKREGRLAPCHAACPIGNDIPKFVSAIARGEPTEALRILLEENPFPGVCGRVCRGFCMDRCNRAEIDESVNVSNLERLTADLWEAPAVGTRPGKGHAVAVVGAGPAGLACSYFLARLGHDVTLFESADSLGGLMRTGIPSYRLPRDILNREIDRILKLGVAVRTGTTLGENLPLEELAQFDAVFLGLGAQKEVEIDLPSNGEGAGLITGLGFLREVNSGKKVDIGKKVAVIGGGNTAVDSARVARRLGAKVFIVYRRSEDEMPAFHTEIEEAREEGIEFLYLTSPVGLRRKSGNLEVLTCCRNVLGEPGPDGRRQPIPIKEDSFDLDVNSVILAIGERPDVDFLSELIPLDKGRMVVDACQSTRKDGIFAGGDMVSQIWTVSHAISSGKRAAMAIDLKLSSKETSLSDFAVNSNGGVSFACYLEGKKAWKEIGAEVVSYTQLNGDYLVRTPRFLVAKVSRSLRKNSFAEVNLGYDPETGQREAERCISCGTCNVCENCYLLCPDMAISMTAEGPVIDYDYCKGCGICIKECPCGALEGEVG